MPRRAPPLDIEPIYRPPSIDTLATVRQRGVLRVGVVPVEPMVMRDRKGELVGYSVDIARRLAADIGVAVEFVPSSWGEVVPDLLGRQFDLVATGLWVTVPRALVVNFTDPTAVEGVYLVAGKSKAAGFASPADFDKPGVTIAVAGDTAQALVAQKLFPKATLLRVSEDELAAVLQGRAHAAVMPTIAPASLLRAAPDRLFLPSSQPLASTSAGIAVRKGDADFLAFLNTWLSLVRNEGWLDERAQYWSTSGDWLK